MEQKILKMLININEKISVINELDILNKKILTNHDKRISQIETKYIVAEEKEDSYNNS